jgi:hypothetical protein
MKTINFFIGRGVAAFAVLFFVGLIAAAAQTSVFTYQGRLTDGSGAASGNYELRITNYGLNLSRFCAKPSAGVFYFANWMKTRELYYNDYFVIR